MRIRAITPIHVGRDELARRQARYHRLSPTGLTVDLHDLPAGSEIPRSLEDADGVQASEEAVGAAIRETDPAAYDLVLPDCVLDPAVGVVTGPVPVVGIMGLVSHHLSSLSRPYASVTRNEAIRVELARKLTEYGTDRLHTGGLVLDLSFDAIADDDAWGEALLGARRAAAEAGARVVVNGCSAVELFDRHDGLPLAIDPTALALELLASTASRHAGGAARVVA